MGDELRGDSLVHLNVRFSTEAELKQTLDFLYVKSKEGISFTGLIEAMVNEVTIVTAIHNIKSNKGSKTAGTDTDKKWGKPNYFYEAPGMSREATKFLVESGVKIIGIDCYSLDKPFMAMVKQYYRTNDKKCLWPAHFYGREKEYCHIERLTNLDKIPMNYGFKFCCFPIKLKEMGAAWVRAVAIIE